MELWLGLICAVLLAAAVATVAGCLRPLLQLTHDLWPPHVSYPEDQLPAAILDGAADDCGTHSQRRRLFTPLRLRGLTLRNRVIKAAAFEAGCDTSGAPLPSLIAHHREVAAGGAALTTVAYASVSVDGRSFASQLLLTERAAPGLRALADAVHSEGGAAALQLTHAGSFAKPSLGRVSGPQLAPSRIFNPAAFNFSRAMTRKDMNRLVADFRAGAALAVACGMDAIEVHLGHGYLLSQFLSPFANRRTDEYGGKDIRDRMRFPLEVLRAVRDVVGTSVPMLVKFNLGDGFRGGLALSDAVLLAQTLHREGLADILLPSGGWVTRNGLFMLRGGVPLTEMVAAQPHCGMRWSLRLFGWAYVPALPWRRHFFEEAALAVLAALPATANVCLLGGLNSMLGMEASLRKGFAAVAVARMILREPGIIARMEEKQRAVVAPMSKDDDDDDDVDVVSLCSHCNLCIVGSTMAETPLACVEREADGQALDIEELVVDGRTKFKMKNG